MPPIDWHRLQWYGVLAIGVGFSLAGVFIAITRDSGGWIVFLFFVFCAAMAAHELWPQFVEGKRRYDPAVLLRRYPGPVRLRVPKRRLIFFFVSGIVFGICLVWVALHGDELDAFEKAVLWAGTLGVAAASPIIAMMILRGSTLRLDGEGLEIFQGFKHSRHLWADASEFAVADVNVLAPSQYLMVMFDDAKLKDGTLAKMNRSFAGYGGALPDTYGLPPQDLAWLLNEWRARAVNEVTQPPASRSFPGP